MSQPTLTAQILRMETQMTLTRRQTLGLFAAAGTGLAFTARPALAREPDVFQSAGVAINGTDAVAYFTDARPVAGSAQPYPHMEWRDLAVRKCRKRRGIQSDPRGLCPSLWRLLRLCSFARLPCANHPRGLDGLREPSVPECQPAGP